MKPTYEAPALVATVDVVAATHNGGMYPLELIVGNFTPGSVGFGL